MFQARLLPVKTHEEKVLFFFSLLKTTWLLESTLTKYCSLFHNLLPKRIQRKFSNYNAAPSSHQYCLKKQVSPIPHGWRSSVCMQNRSAQNTVAVLVEVLKSENSDSRILISYRCCLCTHVSKALADMVRQCSTYMEWCNTSKEWENFLNYLFKLWLSPAICLKISATWRLDHSSKTKGTMKNLCQSHSWLQNSRLVGKYHVLSVTK